MDLEGGLRGTKLPVGSGRAGPGRVGPGRAGPGRVGTETRFRSRPPSQRAQEKIRRSGEPLTPMIISCGIIHNSFNFRIFLK